MTDTISIDTYINDTRHPRAGLVDVRPTPAFNGWALQGDERGGHIPGALSFPATWASRLYDRDLIERLDEKGLRPDVPIVAYGHDDEEAIGFADRLVGLGFDQLTILKGGFPAWAARNDLEVSRLANYSKLVYPEWLYALLDGKAVPEAPGGDVVVFHVNYGVPKDYAAGHIPGAFHLDTNVLEDSADWNRRPSEDLARAVRHLGITKDTTVILYGRDTAKDSRETKPGRRAGQIAATRAAAILMYAGVEDVRLLDGGFNAWRGAGYGIDFEENTPEPAAEFGTTIPANPSYFIDYEEAVDLLSDPEGVLVSIRSKPENIGETSGYNYIEQTGDIPGAVWGDNGTDAYHMENYRSVDNTMRDFNEVASNWRGAGITPDKKVSFYCGTGWRASETLFYAYLMGWPNVSVYDGGWFEWTRRTAAG